MTPFVRPDGRAADQLRPLTITPGFLPNAEGSALIETGHTKVICAASVENGVPPFRKGSGQGWVTAEYAMLPRATSTRTGREVNRGRPSGRTSEIQRLIGRSLRAAIDFKKLGERSILIDCDVLQADGGTRTAAITGAWVALALAVRQMLDYNLISEDPLLYQIAAVSVGVVDKTPLLDLCYEEDSAAEVDMNVVMTSADEFIEIQSTAEGAPFNHAALGSLLDLSRLGVQQLAAGQREALAR
ncbi:MAG: ribonuclease PH [Acidobacteria bacterium]|nr:ribonuclease PH [Acidobacteriota bacterium]